MSELLIICNGNAKTVEFDGKQRLSELLIQAGVGIAQPCAGTGQCGKCAVALEGCVSQPNEQERKAGTRLACQAEIYGDSRVTLPDQENRMLVESVRTLDMESCDPMAGRLGLCVDIGTTTLAAALYDLKEKKLLSEAAAVNPQRSIASDVIGRISAAMEGQLPRLQKMILEALDSLLQDTCVRADRRTEEVDVMVVTGNTTMLYLLTGRNPACLGSAPFHADTLFDDYMQLHGRRAYLPPCVNAFVGADISCAVLASGMLSRKQTALLCDIGTNGELALWHKERLYLTSTAAGPAFEGAGISCGCCSVPGAVDRVWTDKGRIHFHTIEEKQPIGVCGSGLIDGISALLQLEIIGEDGSITGTEVQIAEGVCLQQRDIRQIQVAKAAISAGIDVLLGKAGLTAEDVHTVYLAGGFGSHIRLESAAQIGLIPKVWVSRTSVLGNAALTGAAMLLLDQNQQSWVRQIAADAVCVNLSGDMAFSQKFVEEMYFGDI